MATKLATIIADFTTQLASELSIGGTTLTLSSATDDDGVALPSGRYFFTIDAANSQKEHISCDLSGTSLTNIKTVSRQGVETAGALRKHRVGASIGITDFAHILQINALLAGTTDLNYLVPLKYDGTATISDLKQLATKAYVDGVAIAGSPDATTSTKGISTVSVAPVSAATPIAVGQNDPQFVNYFAETGAANAYVITPSPSIGAYAVGQRFSFKATNANTTTSTININGLGAKTIYKAGGATVLASGDIAAGMIVTIEYDGAGFLMLNPVANAPTTTTSTSFGNGADGALTYDGSTTILGMAPAANVYTLTRDIYGTTITVNSGVTIETAGYRIFASVLLSNAGTIKRTPNNGGNASGITAGTAGTALSSGTIYGGLAGVAGANGINSGGGTVAGTTGPAGTAQTESIGVAGVAGGYGGGHTGSTGRSGTGAVGALTLSVQKINNVVFATSMREFQAEAIKYIKASSGSSGGGSGGNNGVSVSGGGGGSGSTGGIVWIAAKTITNTGTISATGGNGGNGANASSGAAGGGGGGAGGSGGVVVLIYNTITLGTVSVAGGAGGTAGTGNGGGESGSVGSTGTTGTIIQLTA